MILCLFSVSGGGIAGDFASACRILFAPCAFCDCVSGVRSISGIHGYFCFPGIIRRLCHSRSI